MKKRLIAAAVPVLVAGSLAAAAPGTSQAAGDREATPQAPTAAKAAQATTLQQCTGGVQKKAVSGGTSDFVGTSSSKVVPGTVVQFRGPKKASDALFVTVTAPWTFVDDNGDAAQVRVEIDGVDMKPGSLAPESVGSSNNFVSSFAGQYCAKIKGGGFHQVRLVLDHLDDGDGSGTSYLYNPMIHVEVAD